MTEHETGESAPPSRPDGTVVDGPASLLASKATLDQLINGNPFGVYVVDADFRFSHASDGARRAFGDALSPLLGKRLDDALRTIWAEPFASAAIARFTHTLQTGEPYVATDTYEQRADRPVREAYDWRIERIVMPDGRFGVVCYFHDLTERRAYEARLQESAERLAASERRYRTLVETSGAIFWTLSPTGTVDEPQPSWQAFTGQSFQEAKDRGYIDAIHPKDRETFTAAWQRAISGSDRYDVEYRLRRRDGAWRLVEAHGAPVLDGNGRIVEWVGASIDVTDARAADDALKRSELRQSFLLQLADAIRPLSDARLIQDTACGLLGEHLGVDLAAFGDLKADRKDLTVTREWRRPDMPSLIGSRPLDAFGRLFAEQLANGLPVTLEDTHVDPRITERGARDAWAAIGARAAIAHALVKDGRPAGALVVHSRQPRHWSADEISLVVETGQRLWEAVERARAESTLKETEAFSRQVSDIAPSILYVYDLAAKRTVWANRETAVSLGYTLEEIDAMAGRVIETLMHPDDFSRYGAHFARVIGLRDQETAEFEYRFRHKTGGWVWLLSRDMVFRRDAAGQPIEIIGSALDITARKQAEASLLDSETRLRLATESAEVGFWDVDLVKDELVWPPRVKAMFGISASSPVSMRDFFAGLHPDDRDFVSRAFAAACDSGERALYDVEYRTIGKEDGVVRWVAAKGRGQFDDAGRCVRVIGTAIDITARKEAEARLSLASERVELALDAGAIIGTWNWDLQNDLLTADARFARSFGLDPAGCEAGIRLRDAIGNVHPEDQASLLEGLNEALRRGGPYAQQYRVKRADGRYYWIEANGRVECATDGTPLRFPGVLLDVEGRRSVEAERDQAIARFKAVMEATPGVVYFKDLDGRILLANQGTGDIIGKPPEEFIGRTDSEFLGDTAEARTVMENDRRVVETGVTQVFEERISWPDGREAIWLSTKAPFRDNSGNIVGLIGTSIEITDRKRVERELQASQDRLRKVLDQLYAFVGVTTPDGILIEANAAPVEAAGLTIADVVGKPFWETYWWSYDKGVQARLKDACRRAARGETVRYDVPVRLAGDTLVTIDFQMGPLRDDEGRISHLIPSATIVEQRVQAQAALERLNADLERRVHEAIANQQLWGEIVEANDAFIQAVDPDLRLIAMNGATADEYERRFGRRPNIGDGLDDILARWPDQLARVRSAWSGALDGHSTIETEPYGDPQRGQRWYETKYSPLARRDGTRMGALMISYDVTARIEQQQALAKAQAQLFEAQKMETIGQLTGGVAHDFNNLLSAILSNLDLARKRVGDERALRLIDGAVKGAERGAALTKRLLAFARRQDLKVEVVDVRRLFDDMSELLVRSLGPGIRIAPDFEPDLPPVKVDANQLELAILNICVNARDAMPLGGTLGIAARLQVADGDLAPGDYVRISITDTGTGMDPATLSKATDPFFTTKGVGKGTGLGLSMVDGLAAQSGGDLRLTSELGRGTTVDLLLPRADEAARPISAPRPERTTGDTPQGLTVLVVDDDALVAMGTVAMLEDMGHKVLSAYSGRKAIEHFDAHPTIDLVITDQAMPGMTGTELARRLIELRPSLPILLATGYAELPNGEDPGLPKLSKPFRQEDLANAIAALDKATFGRRNFLQFRR